MNGTQPAQNAAHRNDLTWIKVGRSEYMRGDGMTIRRNCNTSRWEITDIDGNAIIRWGRPLTSHSLTYAKLEVASFEAATA